MSKMPKMPVARRSSVSSANLFLIASRARRFFTSLPCRRMTPLLRVATPKIFSSTSVRPEPSRPARPTISPLCTLKETSRSLEYMAVRPSTSSSTPPISLSLGGKRFVSSRPTISLMMRSIVISAAGSVATHAPSRMTVTSSEIRRISSILWEI